MPEKIKRTAKNIKRPQWESVKRAYDEINTANPSDENLQKIFKQAIIENGIWRGKTKESANIVAQKIIDSINNNQYDDFVWQRYALVGGQPLKEYINYKNFFGKSPDYPNYDNTCALQVSYALNRSGMLLEKYISHNKSKRPIGFESATILTGNDGHNYLTSVLFVIKFLTLKEVWGSADEPYNPKQMKTKQENMDFYNSEFMQFNKIGLVAMEIDGWEDAQGHITLWDGIKHKFLDDNDINDSKNYLTKIDGIDKYGRQVPIVTKLYFWELK